MNGEIQLNKMLATMAPILDPQEYVYCVLPDDSEIVLDLEQLDPVMQFRETEGLTLVVEKSRADALSLPYDASFRRITLTVHSSLLAVGLTAAVSTALANNDISANMAAGYYHDHLFVPVADSERALSVLRSLSADVA